MHDNPETVALFDRVNVEHPESPEFAGHMIRVLTGLDLMINMLQDERVRLSNLTTAGTRPGFVQGGRSR